MRLESGTRGDVKHRENCRLTAGCVVYSCAWLHNSSSVSGWSHKRIRLYNNYTFVKWLFSLQHDYGINLLTAHLSLWRKQKLQTIHEANSYWNQSAENFPDSFIIYTRNHGPLPYAATYLSHDHFCLICYLVFRGKTIWNVSFLWNFGCLPVSMFKYVEYNWNAVEIMLYLFTKS